MADESKRRGARRWTGAMRETFLETLSQTCNVRQSAVAAGVTPWRAYELRLRDAGFAQEWGAALAAGYARVEERLVRDAAGEGGPDAPPMDKYDREQALNLLKFHHGAVGRPHAGGTPPRAATEAETDAAILKKLAALKRRMKG